MYEGPVIDAYLFPPVRSRPVGANHGLDWENDPRLHRVTKTFGRSGSQVYSGGEDSTVSERVPTPPPKDGHELLALMDELDVEKAALMSDEPVPAGTAEHVHQRHEEMDEVRRLAPDRLANVGCIVPPVLGPATFWDVLENPRLLEAAVEEFDLKGLQIPGAPTATPPNDRWFYPLYAKCVELAIPVFIYVGMPGPYWPMDANHPKHLDDICLAFPELVVVAHHMGDPWVQMLTHMAGKFENLYICTCAWSPKRYPPELLEFLGGRWHGTRGADKVIFGTDSPLVELRRGVDDARNLELPDDVLEPFLYGNAQRVIWGES
ncbi:MAG TPA: amidohydrolase family protein [Thermoleophilaceae bacterium]|nr:amidohydrolase family protein [Thermoleophilaceae bacterium]